MNQDYLGNFFGDDFFRKINRQRVTKNNLILFSNVSQNSTKKPNMPDATSRTILEVIKAPNLSSKSTATNPYLYPVQDPTAHASHLSLSNHRLLGF